MEHRDALSRYKYVKEKKNSLKEKQYMRIVRLYSLSETFLLALTSIVIILPGLLPVQGRKTGILWKVSES